MTPKGRINHLSNICIAIFLSGCAPAFSGSRCPVATTESRSWRQEILPAFGISLSLPSSYVRKFTAATESETDRPLIWWENDRPLYAIRIQLLDSMAAVDRKRAMLRARPVTECMDFVDGQGISVRTYSTEQVTLEAASSGFLVEAEWPIPRGMLLVISADGIDASRRDEQIAAVRSARRINPSR